MTIGQAGQYNYSRCLQRGDVYGARYAEIKFCADVFSMVFLFNRRYAPFYKWISRAAGSLPILGQRICSEIKGLLEESDSRKRHSIIEKICDLLAGELIAQGLSDSTSDFLVDHGPEVQRRIRTASIRKKDVWIG